MAEFEDKEIVVGAMRLHYLDWGGKGKQPMLLLHGGSQSAHSWDEFSRAMRGDYHVVALNQRGHGDSSWSKTGIYTVGAHMRDIGGFVNALGLRDMVLVGLSMGGRNAATYAALHPEKIARLVIVDIGPETMSRGSENIRRFTNRADVLPGGIRGAGPRVQPAPAPGAASRAAAVEPAPASRRTLDVEVRPPLPE